MADNAALRVIMAGGDAMQQDILIIGVLFPAIPLMMVNFGNCYTVLANLIRHLHDEVIRHNVSPKDAERFLLQITVSGQASPDRDHPVLRGDFLCSRAWRDDCRLF